MFLLNGNNLPIDTPFTVTRTFEIVIPDQLAINPETGEEYVAVPGYTETHQDDVQYPANWLRYASDAERAEIGITEVPDPVRADDRFYWDGDVNNPKPLDQVKAMLTSDVKQTAYSLLQPTDYKITRQVETGVRADDATLNYREFVREASRANIAKIDRALTVGDLAAMTFEWPVI